MCRAVIQPTLVLLVIVLTIPGSGMAQDAEELRQRLDGLARVWEELKEAERRERQALRMDVDSVRVGELVVVTKQERMQFVRAAAEKGWDKIVTWMGPGIDRVPDTLFRFYVERVGESKPAISLYSGHMNLARYPEIASPDDLAREMLLVLAGHLASRVDSAGVWIAGLPFEPLETKWRRQLYRDLATAESRAVRRCFRGDIESCAVSLNVVELEDPVLAWYSAEDRRYLVERKPWPWVSEEVVRTCLAGIDELCLDVLRSQPASRLIPLSANARRLLVEQALLLGGDSAFYRLLDPRALGISQRLAVTAGVSIDSLVATWRQAVMSSRPLSPAMDRVAGWMTFIWVVFLAILASRSSRWR